MQQNDSFLITCVFCKTMKSSRFFLGPFWGKFWLMFKKHCKNRDFNTHSETRQVRYSECCPLGEDTGGHMYEKTSVIIGYIYIHTSIYIYIYAVKLLSGPSLGVFGSYYLVQVGFLEVIIWSKFVFLAYKNSGFKRFVLHTQLSFCVFCAQLSGNFLKIAFFKKRVQKLGFSIFSVLSLNFENSLF